MSLGGRILLGVSERGALVPAIARAAAALDALLANAGDPMSLSDLARQLRIPKSSMSNICSQLVQERLLLRVDGMYRLGPKLAALGAVYLASVDVVREFQSICSERDPSPAATAKLAALGEHGEIVYLARHDVARPAGLSLDIRVQQPAHCTASGKAILASLPDEAVTRWLETSAPLVRRTANSITDRQALWAVIAGARERGFAVDDEECIEGVVCVGTAISTKDDAGEPLGLSLALLKQHAVDSRLSALAAEVRRLALALVDRLGRGYQVLGPPGEV
jgi:IclR family transcriptional regulator, blcABC operon repressor